MLCLNCGYRYKADAKFCIMCGLDIKNTDAAVIQTSGKNTPQADDKTIPHNSRMSFAQSIITCFKKYADFKGRASRSEYWWFALFISLFGSYLINQVEGIWKILTYLGLIIPLMSVGTRRLHDTGRSGWWQLLQLTGVGIVFLLIWYCSKGDADRNRFDS